MCVLSALLCIIFKPPIYLPPLQEHSHVKYYFAAADVLVLAFSLTDRSSLEAAKELRRFADTCCDQHSRLPAVLVGTKLDL